MIQRLDQMWHRGTGGFVSRKGITRPVDIDTPWQEIFPRYDGNNPETLNLEKPSVIYKYKGFGFWKKGGLHLIETEIVTSSLFHPWLTSGFF